MSYLEKLYGSCSCGSDECGATQSNKGIKRKVTIDFLFLDLNVCTRCQGTDQSLDDALREVSKVLESSDIDIEINKINVINEELAVKHRFISSPTIRVNGHDIQMEVRESLCQSCGDLCGDEVDCRVWDYNGIEYNVPPKAMIIEAILKEVYREDNSKTNLSDYGYILPDNLKKFYEGIKNK